ncbi:MAG TPA: hypothetical protein VHZ95_12480 [Polyangiales bacterium]|jgi:hypothetical protein|nr:hypothetical protein [Polyangiales bacterium]
MGSLTALLLATPIFGFSLQPPTVSDVLDLSAKTVAAEATVQSDEGSAAKSGDDSQAEYIEQIKRRNSIAGIHRIMGISTWVAMTLTVAAGFIDYYNLYGFGASQGNNPCVKGTAIGGDGGCNSFRTVKSSLAYTTTALYATTFTLSLMMPDPDNLAQGKGEFASTLRLHKTLRWVHFGGMIAQILLGIVMAHSLLGLDRANNYGTLQALSTVHMGLGLVTYGALTWAGALMTF